MSHKNIPQSPPHPRSSPAWLWRQVLIFPCPPKLAPPMISSILEYSGSNLVQAKILVSSFTPPFLSHPLSLHQQSLSNLSSKYIQNLTTFHFLPTIISLDQATIVSLLDYNISFSTSLHASSPFFLRSILHKVSWMILLRSKSYHSLIQNLPIASCHRHWVVPPRCPFKER